MVRAATEEVAAEEAVVQLEQPGHLVVRVVCVHVYASFAHSQYL